LQWCCIFTYRNINYGTIILVPGFDNGLFIVTSGISFENPVRYQIIVPGYRVIDWVKAFI
jgi:hypothetical protein